MTDAFPEHRCPECGESALDGWRLVKCTKCGTCFEVCPFSVVVKI